MDILILGGTRFFGKELIKNLLGKGHNVTIATRGNRPDPFGSAVSRLCLDRTDRTSLAQALDNKRYDLVYDNICYASNDMRNLLECLPAGRLVVTSSSAVYESGRERKEDEFDPFHYPVRWGGRGDFSYDEGKRQCESVLFRSGRDAAAVRFPVILGREDYTGRLHSYVKAVVRGTPLFVDNLDAKLSFFSAEGAGAFLCGLAESACSGPVNAAFTGEITLREILSYLEAKTGRGAVLSDAGIPGGYHGMRDGTLALSKAGGYGFSFEAVETYLFPLLDFYVEQERKDG